MASLMSSVFRSLKQNEIDLIRMRKCKVYEPAEKIKGRETPGPPLQCLTRRGALILE